MKLKLNEASCEAIYNASDAVDDLIKSSHVIMVPWCQCCEARVQVDHVCECEQSCFSDEEAKDDNNG
jgi:hypothetical protein